MIILNYPHFRPSFEPKRLRAEEIWARGEAARTQIFGLTPRPKIDLARLIKRSRQIRVNGLAFETHWELGRPVVDDAGNPVMGAVEHDESWPEAAMIYLNGDEIGDRDDLGRSTAAHELGHAVFDTPSWIQRSRQRSLPFGRHEQPERRFQPAPNTQAPRETIDWREWRANEFMGAFLAPRRPWRESSAFAHNRDYTEVVLSGQVFRLGLLQAAVVRQLHGASRGPNPWVSGKDLLARAGAQTMRMVDLFKAKSNWRTLIASDGTGRYRLNLPERPAARVAHRAYRRFRFANSG